MNNPYGITLDREWAEWAAKIGVSSTVAAALLVISRSRPLPEVVARLTPGELEQVVGIIGRWPECFPPGTLAALKSVRLTRSPDPSAVSISTYPGYESRGRRNSLPYGLTSWAFLLGVRIGSQADECMRAKFVRFGSTSRPQALLPEADYFR